MSLPTITELANDVSRGKRSADSAAVWAMDRRDAGLCDECPNRLPSGHDYERGSLCSECELCPDCMEPRRECDCDQSHEDDAHPSRPGYLPAQGE